jgi:hypothetical protein
MIKQTLVLYNTDSVKNYLAIGYWLLAISYWLLAIGCWRFFHFYLCLRR